MDVEIGSRAETLDERDRRGHGFGTFESRLLDQKCRDHPVDDLQDRREELGMGREETTKRDRKRQYPLPLPSPGDEVVDQVGGGLRHASRSACN